MPYVEDNEYDDDNDVNDDNDDNDDNDEYDNDNDDNDEYDNDSNNENVYSLADNERFKLGYDFVDNDKILSPAENLEDFSTSELKDYKRYLLECCEIIVSFKQNEVFQKSLKEVKGWYKFGMVELNSSSSKATLEKWGRVFHLKKLRPQ